MVERATLEMWCTGNGTVGSNPTLSANKNTPYTRGVFVVEWDSKGIRSSASGTQARNPGCGGNASRNHLWWRALGEQESHSLRHTKSPALAGVLCVIERLC